MKDWVDNYHPDGEKGIIWMYHLFDLLATDYLPDYQIYRKVSHLREGEFLWKYGVSRSSKR